MDGGLVDLSLFTTSPANDGHFSLNDEGVCSPSFIPSSQPNHRSGVAMKPLPPIPHRRLGALAPDHRSTVFNPARSVLERVKKMRVDPSPPSTNPQSSPSTYSARQQTLQQRRNGSITPSLTIPTPSHLSTSRGAISAAAVTTPRPAAPMIWLADEEMWLVADAVESHTSADLYGFYAPAPLTDPGPWAQFAEDDPNDLPPVYTTSPTSAPSPGDFSPVRTQFTALLEATSSAENSRPQTATSMRAEDAQLSPMFQEAISGMSFGLSYQGPGSGAGSGSGWSRRPSRRESYHSDSGVSPLSSTADTPRKAGRPQRHASARH